MVENNSVQKSFSERIINFDFERFYTLKIRVLCHILMWLLFTCLTITGNYYGYHFSFLTAFLLSIRMTICNIIIFYLFFYFILPQTLNKNKIILLVFAIPLCIQFWLLINHYYFSVLYEVDTEIKDNALSELLKNNNSKSFFEVITPKNMIAHGMEVILSISPFMFIKIVFDISKMYSKLLLSDRKNENLEFENIVIEKQFLQTQLNPHFLFNTLNNLYGLVIKKDDIAPTLILKLSEIMRYTLYDITTETIPIEKELEFMENYFEMEKMRYPKDYPINLVTKNNSFGLKIPPLLFFIFIENAFKYGLKSEKPMLNISIEINENIILFSVENDKQLKNYKKTHSGGIGIENVKKRLNLLYYDKYKLDLRDTEQNFSVHLKLEI